MTRLLTGIWGALCVAASAFGAWVLFDLQFSPPSGAFFGSIDVPLWMWAVVVVIGALGAVTLTFAVIK